MVLRAHIRTETGNNVELAVAAADGTERMFIPNRGVNPHLRLAPTMMIVR